MSKKKKLFESEDFDKQKKLFTSDDFDKREESTDGTDEYNNRSNKEDDILTGNAKKTNGDKIIIGIVAAAVLIGGVYFFGIRNNGSEVNGETTTEQVSQAEETTTSEALGDTNANAESAPPNDEIAKSSEANMTTASSENGNVSTTAKVDDNKANRHSANEFPSAQPAKSSLPKQTTTTTPKVSATINGDVEEFARRVIRGDFGNGQTRKDKLGASYSEIQGRVNEMYRQGLVH